LSLTERVTRFLNWEAWLLDNWRLEEWLALVTDDISYVVPAADCPEGDPQNSVVFINDDLTLLRGRITRLQSRHAHREFPTSRTRRFITNVLVDDGPEQTVHVTASFQVYRFRSRQTAVYVGYYEMTLVADGETFKIRSRKATLDQEALDEHGAISIIL
jgi:p-cumate 2,3-dioxygenase subunit beta